MWGPLVVSWVIDPINYIDISTINHTELPILKESCVCIWCYTQDAGSRYHRAELF